MLLASEPTKEEQGDFSQYIYHHWYHVDLTRNTTLKDTSSFPAY